MKTSDRAGVVPPSFRRKTTLQHKVPSSNSDPGPVRTFERERQKSCSVNGRQEEVRDGNFGDGRTTDGDDGPRRQSQSRAESLAERNRELYEAQRRARRGPTPEIFFAKHIDNSRM